MEWEILGKILRELQYDTRRVMNSTIQYFWEWQGFSSDYKSNFDIYPKFSDNSDYKTVEGYCYDIFKDKFNKLYTANLSTSIKNAAQRWKTDRNNVIKGLKSIANYNNFLHCETVNRIWIIAL